MERDGERRFFFAFLAPDFRLQAFRSRACLIDQPESAGYVRMHTVPGLLVAKITPS
jgi:hypothetical protein